MEKQPIDIYNQIKTILNKKYEILDRIITIKATMRKLKKELEELTRQEKEIVKGGML